jgi:hypothetical protein
VQFGIRRVTMDDVARHLGMSKKTIYEVFKDKDELVQSLLETDLNMNHTCMEGICEESANAVEECIKLMKFVTGMFSRINPWLFFDLQKYHPLTWAFYQKFKEERMKGQIVTNLERGIKEGLYRSDLNVQVLAIMRMSEVEMGLNPLVFPPDKFDLTKVQVGMLDHFLHGITTLKGHKLLNKYQQIQEED